MNGSVRSRHTKGAISGSRNGVLEDPDSLDLDFDAIPGLEVASAVASLQLASSGNRPAAPHFTRVDRLESGEELEHLRERPEGSLAFADPRVLVDESAVSIAQPFLVVRLRRRHGPRRPSLERLEAHRRDGLFRPHDVQWIAVVVRG